MDSVHASGGFGEGFVRDAWYVAGLSRDLKPGKIAKREFLGEPVLMGRTRAGEAYAISDTCPHRAAALSTGRLHREADGSDSIECPYHGWRFGPDGACKAIPSLTADKAFDVSLVRVRRYPTAEQQGLVWIWMASDPRRALPPPEPPPTIPGVVGGKPKLVDRQTYGIHIDHAILSLIDLARGRSVWRWIRDLPSRQRERTRTFRPSEAGFTMIRPQPSSYAKAYAILGGEPLTEMTFRLPGLSWKHVTIGKKQVLALSAMTPVNSHKTRVNKIVWSDHWAFVALYPLIWLAARAFLWRESRMVDSQTPGLERNPRLRWVGDPDQQAHWYRQCKREWAASRWEGRPFRNPVRETTLRWRT